MGNHIHLLLKVDDDPLEQIMRHIAGSYVYWYNQKYDRIGNQPREDMEEMLKEVLKVEGV